MEQELISSKDMLEATKALPEVKNAMIVYQEAEAEDKQAIEGLINEIDMTDTNSIIFFGNKAQEQLSTVSENMLEGVRNKDLGSAGDSLNEVVATLRGFDVSGLDPNVKQSFFARLFGKAKPLVKFMQQYEQVQKQIDSITNNLDDHKGKLLHDIVALDRLYEANLQYFHDLDLYIAAGEEKLRELDEETIPEKAKLVSATDDMLEAQELRDMRSARDDLERRVHDLKLTRQVTLQSLPSIRLVQENDKGLVTKINSTVANTIPLWKQQLATAVTIARSGAAARTIKEATDLTNELLEKNAENLQQANKMTREQIERGVFDIESVKKANQSLIDTIQESLQIADEGKRMRKEAEGQLIETENALRKQLAAASAHVSGSS
ncbi:MAG: toxic anion resistance protein [Gammaproteobacteria bacterium]|nr:toxic anion resistance protein [Gammaproteobacteria bacterium]